MKGVSLEARAELHDLFVRYCDALDDKNWGLLDDVFTDDVVAQFREPQQGRDAVVGFIRGQVEKTAACHHLIGNFKVTGEGTEVVASCRVQAFHAGHAPEKNVFESSLATYIATCVLTDDGWRAKSWSEVFSVVVGRFDAVFGSGVPDSWTQVII